jgi:hypothetical protein
MALKNSIFVITAATLLLLASSVSSAFAFKSTIKPTVITEGQTKHVTVYVSYDDFYKEKTHSIKEKYTFSFDVNVKKDQKARVCAYDADNDERFDTVCKKITIDTKKEKFNFHIP